MESIERPSLANSDVSSRDEGSRRGGLPRAASRESIRDGDVPLRSRSTPRMLEADVGVLMRLSASQSSLCAPPPPEAAGPPAAELSGPSAPSELAGPLAGPPAEPTLSELAGLPVSLVAGTPLAASEDSGAASALVAESGVTSAVAPPSAPSARGI